MQNISSNVMLHFWNIYFNLNMSQCRLDTVSAVHYWSKIHVTKEVMAKFRGLLLLRKHCLTSEHH